MLDLRAGVLHLDIGHGVRAALIAQEQAVALGEVAHAARGRADADEAAIGVVRLARRNPLGDDRRAAVLAVMDHLGAGVGLLEIVGDRDRVELAHAVFAVEHAGGVFPRHRRAGFDLRPRDLGTIPLTQRALGDEVVDAALALGIAGIPVLHGRILDLGIVHRDQFDHGGMELVFIAHRRGAAFEVADVGALLRDDQRAFELPRVFGIDAEIGRKLHRAAHAFGHVDEGAVREDRAIQRREVVVAHRHDLAEPLPDEVRIFADRFGDREEDHARAQQFGAEAGGDADGIEHCIDRNLLGALDACQHFLLAQRDAELVIDALDLGIEVVEAVQLDLLLGRGVVIGVLIVDRRIADLGPVGLRHGLPQAEGLQPPFEHPFRLVLLGADEADSVFGEPFFRKFGLDVRRPAMLVIGDLGRGLAGFHVRFRLGLHFDIVGHAR